MVTLNRHIAIQLNLLVQQSSDSSQVFTDMVNHVAVQLREPWYARLFTSTLWFHGDSNMLGNVSIGQHAKHMNFFLAMLSLPFHSLHSSVIPFVVSPSALTNLTSRVSQSTWLIKHPAPTTRLFL
jgi:hypothetical protein